MNEAQKILDLIESVDPKDTDTLDEIDARTREFVTGQEYISQFVSEHGTRWYTHMEEGEEVSDFVSDKYTRSRDALKAIRPEGWIFHHSLAGESGHIYAGFKRGTNLQVISAADNRLPTEELAELHAIIQATEYERSKK